MSGVAAARPVEVVAAVIQRPGGEFLLAQRPPGKVYAGYWEFPGGKVEPGEPAAAALVRELHEELGIDVEQAYPWIVREYVYAHAHVRLNFFRVTRWANEPTSRETQALSWQKLPDIHVAPVLPANGPIMRALALPPALAITDAQQRGEAELLASLDGALARGLRLVMVREKQMPREQLIALTREIIQRCRPFAARVIVNGDVSVASDCGADGVHLTAAQLLQLDARPHIDWCSASCHNPQELAHAAALGLDFVLLGPVSFTPTHPDAEPLGWERFARMITGYALPVFALGGLKLDDFGSACAAGAHGVAMIRGAWSGCQSFPSDWSDSGSGCAVGIR
jgi:8-oxo-dGTP diphosphatase